MTEQDDALVAEAEDKQAQADFDAGMAMEATPVKPVPLAQADPVEIKPTAATKPAETKPAETKPAETKPATDPAGPAAPAAPKYVRLTQAQYDELSAAAKRTATHEQQFAKAFGSIGDVQKLVRELQSQTPRGGKFEVPKDAFAAMARDFPELAEQVRQGVEATVKALGGAAADVDPARLQRLVTEHVTAREVAREAEALEDAYPDWRKIVGAVDATKQAPDATNPFRKWLGTKDAAYQARINGTNSAAVISRAITAFQNATKVEPTPKPDLAAQLRATRIRDAVQPRGDGAQPGQRTTDDDEFLAGFKAR